MICEGAGDHLGAAFEGAVQGALVDFAGQVVAVSGVVAHLGAAPSLPAQPIANPYVDEGQ